MNWGGQIFRWSLIQISQAEDYGQGTECRFAYTMIET